MDLVLVPQVTGVDPLRFTTEYPPALRHLMRTLVATNVRGGWAGNLFAIRRADA